LRERLDVRKEFGKISNQGVVIQTTLSSERQFRRRYIIRAKKGDQNVTNGTLTDTNT